MSKTPEEIIKTLQDILDGSELYGDFRKGYARAIKDAKDQLVKELEIGDIFENRRTGKWYAVSYIVANARSFALVGKNKDYSVNITNE